LEVGITRHNFGRGPSKDHSTKGWLQLAQWFLRRRLKCEMLTDGRRTKSDDNSSHGLKARWATKNQGKSSDGFRNMDFQCQDWVAQTSIKFKSPLKLNWHLKLLEMHLKLKIHFKWELSLIEVCATLSRSVKKYVGFL
jgi:hypothetical protein